MKKICLLLGDRFDAMLPRERLLVFLALVAALGGLFVLSGLNPALLRYQMARQSLLQSERSLKTLAEQEVLLVEGDSRDPDAAERSELLALDRQLEALRDQLTGGKAGLASPEKMGSMLHELIAAQKNLRLVSIHSGDVADLLAGVPGVAASAPASLSRPMHSLYRHELKLVLRGDYAALMNYLRQVEALPGRLSASEVLIRSEAWPEASLSLSLNINSLERAWLAF
jgi:MSHA biogenesis protein MshJ